MDVRARIMHKMCITKFSGVVAKVLFIRRVINENGEDIFSCFSLKKELRIFKGNKKVTGSLFMIIRSCYGSIFMIMRFWMSLYRRGSKDAMRTTKNPQIKKTSSR